MIRCRSLAEMPLRRALISKIARNHVLNGFLVFSSSVQDVRVVWWPQSAHSNRKPSRSLDSGVERQRAHTGVSPQRVLIQQAQQASSVETRGSNSPADSVNSRH